MSNTTQLTGFASYPTYKESGVPWLGEIPNHWEVANLKYFISCMSGDAIESSKIHKKEHLTNIYPVIGGNGLFGYTDCSNFENECLSIGRVGALCGNVHYVDYKSWINDNALVVKLKRENINLRFLEKFLRIRNLNSIATKTAQPLLTGSQIKNEKILLPSLKEQQAIVQFLDKQLAYIDALVNKQKQLIKKLAEQRSAIISHAVTKGLDPNVAMKESGVEWLGKVPKHWDVLRMKFAVENYSKKVDAQSSEFKYLGLENLESFTGKLIDTESKSEGFVNEFQCNDVLFGKLRPYLSKVYLAKYDGLVSTEALVFRAQKKLEPNYLFYYCLSPDFINIVNASTFGSKMPRADWKNISSLPCTIPSIKEQQQIVDYLDKETQKIDQITESTSKIITKLQEYRSALITQAVTGKIDVRDLVNNDTEIPLNK